MTIYIGADHRGFELKNKLIEWLKGQGHEVEDCGNSIYDPQDDYPDFTNKVAENLIKLNEAQMPVSKRNLGDPSGEVREETRHQALGIVICGSGVGVSVAANRHKGIICALGFDVDQVTHARENDHINMLSIPSDYVTQEKTKEMINAFLAAIPKTGDKYVRRLKKLDI